MRILIVEDEEGIATSLKRGLTADGFTVDIADNGTDGLWLAQTNPYQVLILDLMLPGLNGYRVCRQLRQEGNQVPILMLTAKDGELDEAEGLDTGADDYVTKPFSYPVLLARVRALIRRADSGNASHENELTVGHLRLDLRSRRLWVSGVETEISPRGMTVLSYLMTNAGWVLSKDEILANVWDHAFDGDPNIVEVYISRIRSAIGGNSNANGGPVAVLETVRGVGYRLIESAK